MAEEVKRIPIYKYVKSGKIAAITSNSKFEGQTLIDMSPDMRRIEKIRSIKYLKRDSVTPTGFVLEAIEDIQNVDRNEYSISYRLLRILTDKDIDEERWKATESLSELPVGAHPHVSKEERLWAGEREGNIGSGIILVIWVCVTWWWVYSTINSDGSVILSALVAVVSSYFLIVFKWKAPKKPKAEKLNELNNHKKSFERMLRPNRSRLEQISRNY